MATVITAGNATNGLSLSADNTGAFEFKTGTGAGTTALSIDTSQVVTLNGGVGGLVAGTAVASTSGTSVNFTSIPSWVKRITVMFSGVSTNGTSIPLIQLGDSGGVETSGYLGSGSSVFAGSACTAVLQTTGFGIGGGTAATVIFHGSIQITLLDATANTWCANGVLARSDTAATFNCSGAKSLSATLDRVRITTVGGTDTFDAGTINILYE